MLFSKPEYRVVALPLVYIEDPEDLELGGISVEASGVIDGKEKFCCASYMLTRREMYDNGGYEQLIDLLRRSPGKEVAVRLKLKKGKIKGFKIDLQSMAQAYGDERFLTLELLCWGINDKSYARL